MEPGELIGGRFEVRSVAGKGGMGTVYRALDRTTGAVVALKVLESSARSAGPRFEREVRLLADLDHPGIVSYVAQGVLPGGTPWLAMDWAPGRTLGDVLAEGPLSVGDALTLGRRVAQVLAYAHRRGVVHRDIKPSNLVVPEQGLGATMVLDFGVAGLVAIAGRLTRTSDALGTPGYMAPELYRAGEKVDARTDVFALGCVLFEALAGRPAYIGKSALAMLARVVFDDAPRLSDHTEGAPPAIDGLLARMMARDPDQRPSNGAALVSELDGLARGGALDRIVGRGPTRALTPSERRIISVVLARSPQEADAAAIGATLGGAAAETVAGGAAVGRGLEPLGGTQVEELGDGTMVIVFAGTSSQREQVIRAARCARQLSAATPGARIALVTGRGVVSESAPAGEVVQRGLGLLAEAPEGAVLIDQASSSLLDGRFEIRETDPGRLLGREHTTGLTETRSGEDGPLVGRRGELGLLATAFEDCADGPEAKIILLTGPPGIGKSRLAREALGSVAQDDEARVLTARGDPLGSGAAFGLLGAAVRQLTGIRVGDSAVATLGKLREQVAAIFEGPEVDAAVQALREPLGLRPAGAAPVERNPRAARERLERVLATWLRRVSEGALVVLVLEDLQWGDRASVELVQAVVERLVDAPLLVLGLARPEAAARFPELWAAPEATVLELAGLSMGARRRLLRGRLGKQAAPETIETVAKRSGGNPYLLEELARAQLEPGGSLETLPDSVLAMVERRVSALEPEARRVLRAASVFGGRFWRGGVAALLALAEEETEWLTGVLARLVEADLCVRRPDQGRFAGEPELSFKSDLVRETAYAMLTDEDRRLGHKLAGDWLEQRGEPGAVVLAGHYERGGDALNAIRWWTRAARAALAVADLTGAIERGQRAVELAQGAGADALSHVGEAQLVAGYAASLVGQLDDARERLEVAVSVLEEGSDLWLQAVGRLTTPLSAAGSAERVVELAERVRAILPRGRAPGDAAIMSVAILAHEAFLLGEVEVAREMLGRIEPYVYRAAPWARARALNSLATRASLDGDLSAALSAKRAATDAYAEIDDPRTFHMMKISVGYAELKLGLYDLAEANLRLALSYAQTHRLHRIEALARNNLGVVLHRLGRTDEGIAHEREAIAHVRDSQNRRVEGSCRLYLAEMLAARGELAEGLAEARRGAELLEDFPPLRPYGRAVVAQLQLLAEATDDALATARAAMAAMLASAAEEGEGRVRRVMVEALLAAGQRTAAMAAAVDARSWLEARASRVGDPEHRRAFLERIEDHARIMRLSDELAGAGT